MAVKQFGREVEVIVNDMSFKEPNYRVEFDIGFDYKENPTNTTIKIYNLSNSTISKFAKKSNVIVNSGYKNDSGTSYVGSIQNVNLDVQSPDRVLSLNCLEASNDYLAATVHKSYANNTKASYIIKDLLASLGLEIGAFILKNDITYLRGLTVTGSLRNALKKIVIEDCKSKLYTQHGSIIIRPDGTGDDIGFLLNSDTGLIESPSKLDKTATDGTITADYSIKMLHNHRIRVDSILEVQSRTLNGFVRVNKGKHTCTESDFLTEVEVIVV